MSFNSPLLAYCLLKCYHHLIVLIKQVFINGCRIANKTIAALKPLCEEYKPKFLWLYCPNWQICILINDLLQLITSFHVKWCLLSGYHRLKFQMMLVFNMKEKERFLLYLHWHLERIISQPRLWDLRSKFSQALLQFYEMYLFFAFIRKLEFLEIYSCFLFHSIAFQFKSCLGVTFSLEISF